MEKKRLNMQPWSTDFTKHKKQNSPNEDMHEENSLAQHINTLKKIYNLIS